MARNFNYSANKLTKIGHDIGIVWFIDEMLLLLLLWTRFVRIVFSNWGVLPLFIPKKEKQERYGNEALRACNSLGGNHYCMLKSREGGPVRTQKITVSFQKKCKHISF